MLGISQGATSLVPSRATSRSPRIDLRILIGFVDVGYVSRCHVVGAASGDLSVSLDALRILLGFVDVGYSSRCHVVGAASGDLSVSQDCSSDIDRFCRCWVFIKVPRRWCRLGRPLGFPGLIFRS